MREKWICNEDKTECRGFGLDWRFRLRERFNDDPVEVALGLAMMLMALTLPVGAMVLGIVVAVSWLFG